MAGRVATTAVSSNINIIKEGEMTFDSLGLTNVFLACIAFANVAILGVLYRVLQNLKDTKRK